MFVVVGIVRCEVVLVSSNVDDEDDDDTFLSKRHVVLSFAFSLRCIGAIVSLYLILLLAHEVNKQDSATASGSLKVETERQDRER